MMKGKKTQKTIRSYAPHLAAAAFVMVLVTVLALFAPAYAATSGTLTGLSNADIGLSFSGDDQVTWAASGTTITGSAKSKAKEDACGSDTHYESTLTIANKKSTPATLSFDYAIEQNSGTIKVNGTRVTTNSDFSQELGAREKITIYIKSGSTSAATEITLTDVKLVAGTVAETTFQPSEHGSYTVDGQLITTTDKKSKNSKVGYVVAATPDKGYKFLGWYDLSEGKYINADATTTLNIEKTCTLTAKFTEEANAVFEAAGQYFTDLNEANNYAQRNSSNKITLIEDGSLAAGDYTISSGITLLVPFDAAGTLLAAEPKEGVAESTPEATPYRTLALNENVNITVNGIINVGGQYYRAPGGGSGVMVGPYGLIKMANHSNITVKSGGALYAWGFISGADSGKGSVMVEAGGSVYEWFQIMNFRGGNASTSSEMKDNKVFPISQYAVQNVEVPLTICAGANEGAYTALYMSRTTIKIPISFVGSSGLFNIISGNLTKEYDGVHDRMIYTVSGEAQLNSMVLNLLLGQKIDSADYVLPLTNNMTVNIDSGKMTVNQDTALLPGVQVNVARGAELYISSGHKMYIYDADEWTKAAYANSDKKFVPVKYAPSKKYNRTEKDLVDATLDVNGMLTAVGEIYTTAGGADISSSGGTGKFVQQGTVGTGSVTYQCTQSGNNVTAHEIPITAAKLLNADGTYTETAGKGAGTTIAYSKELGKWGGQPATVEFDGGEGTTENEELKNQLVDLSVNDATITCPIFKKAGHKFLGFAKTPDATKAEFSIGDAAALQILVSKLGAKTGETVKLYAVYEAEFRTVTWNVTGVEGVTPNPTQVDPTASTLTKTVAELFGANAKYLIKSCMISPSNGAKQTVTLPADNIKLEGITSDITVTLELVSYDHIVTVTDTDKYSRTYYEKDSKDVLTEAAITYTAGDKKVITGVNGHTATLTRGADDVNTNVADGWKSFTLSGINADQTVTVTLKGYAHTVDWTRVEDNKGSAITTTRREYVAVDESATLKLSEGFRATGVTGAGGATVTGIETGVVAISGITEDLTVTVTARNYSYAVTWNVNTKLARTDYLDFDVNTANYTADANTVITEASVMPAEKATVTHTNTKVTVTGIGSNVTVTVTTAAPTTEKATYYFGDMSYEYKRNTVLYQWDGTSENKGEWKPVDSFAWQHKPGSRIYEFEDSDVTYVVPNGSVLLVNGSNQTMQYTVTYAPDEGLANAVMTFTAGEDTGRNTLSVILASGEQVMASSTFACDVNGQTLTNAAAGQVTVTSTPYNN